MSINDRIDEICDFGDVQQIVKEIYNDSNSRLNKHDKDIERLNQKVEEIGCATEYVGWFKDNYGELHQKLDKVNSIIEFDETQTNEINNLMTGSKKNIVSNIQKKNKEITKVVDKHNASIEQTYTETKSKCHGIIDFLIKKLIDNNDIKQKKGNITFREFIILPEYESKIQEDETFNDRVAPHYNPKKDIYTQSDQYYEIFGKVLWKYISEDEDSKYCKIIRKNYEKYKDEFKLTSQENTNSQV